MNKVIRIVTGIGLCMFGVAMTLAAIFSVWWLILYGIPSIIVGIVLFFNKGEDRIEERKDLNKSVANKK